MILKRIIEYFKIHGHEWVLEDRYEDMNRWRCLRCGGDTLYTGILKPSRNELVVVMSHTPDKFGYYGHVMTCEQAITSEIMES